MIELAPDFLRGSYPPLITPFTSDGSVDFTTYEKLVDFQIREGSHGIVVNGTSAEPSTLTLSERNDLVSAAIAAAGGRVPVVAATGSQNHAETLFLTEHAARAGADALLVVTPYYVKPPKRGIVAYYEDLGHRSDLPLLMYHIPGRTAATVDLSVLEAIVERTPTFVGMKYAAYDMGPVTEALKCFGPDFRIFVGLEDLSFPMMAIGAGGMINAVSNIAPAAIAQLYELVASGDLAAARRSHFAVAALNDAVFFDTNPIAIKYMAKKLGILGDNHHRMPMMPATAEVERRCDAVLAECDFLKPAEPQAA